MHTYSAYQLIISSELLLPELCSIDDSITTEQPCISIVFGHARRESIPNMGVQGLYYHIQPEVCWLEVPNVSYFLIKHGREIVVEPIPGVDEDSLRLFLYTVCFPLVLIYHNFFLFHGGALQWAEQGVAFLAGFGQGKSTLLASFLKRNGFFLSDDICVLNQEGFILPGFPNLALREDTIKKLDIEKTASFIVSAKTTSPMSRALCAGLSDVPRLLDPAHEPRDVGGRGLAETMNEAEKTKLKLIRPTLQKWYVPLQQAFCSEPSLLKIVYIIDPATRPEARITPLVGLRKIQYLKKNTYNPLFVKGLGKDSFYFKQCAFLAARTSASCVERAQQGFLWNEFADLIEQDLQSRVLECQ